jgi:hypothetical protein
MVSSEDIESTYRSLRFDILGYTGVHEREILSELLEESHNLYTRSGHAESLQVKRLLLDLSSEILQSVYIYDRSQLYKPHVDRLIKLLQAHRSSGVAAAQNLHHLIN